MSDKNFTDVSDLVKKQNQKNISGPKEAEPLGERFELKEVVEHKVEEEVRPFVSPRSETIELPPDLKKLGLQQAGQSQFLNYKNIKLPLTDEKIAVGLHAPVTSSLRWLAEFAVYLLAQAHLGLKIIHGKVVRVLRTG